MRRSKRLLIDVAGSNLVQQADAKCLQTGNPAARKATKTPSLMDRNPDRIQCLYTWWAEELKDNLSSLRASSPGLSGFQMSTGLRLEQSRENLRKVERTSVVLEGCEMYGVACAKRGYLLTRRVAYYEPHRKS